MAAKSAGSTEKAGAKAPVTTKLARAVHEAGHAVADRRLGLDSGGVSIDPEDGLMGWAEGSGVESCWSANDAGPVVLSLCSGYAAVRIAGLSDPEAGCGRDFEQAEQLIEYWELKGDLASWKARAEDLMRQPMNESAVQCISKKLMASGSLDGDHVDVLMQLSDGECSDEEYLQYLMFVGEVG